MGAPGIPGELLSANHSTDDLVLGKVFMGSNFRSSGTNEARIRRRRLAPDALTRRADEAGLRTRRRSTPYQPPWPWACWKITEESPTKNWEGGGTHAGGRAARTPFDHETAMNGRAPPCRLGDQAPKPVAKCITSSNLQLLLASSPLALHLQSFHIIP